MQVNNDLKSTMNLEMQSNLKKQERVNAKDNTSGLRESVSNLKNNESQVGTPTPASGKTASKLEELNKQKVTPELLENTVTELKNDDKTKEADKKADVIEVQKQKTKNKKITDPKDKNKDGKVSASEKHDALNGSKKLQDKNKDGVISDQEKQVEKEKKTTGLIKEVISELKKDDDFKEIKPEHFKGISKMVNTELIDSKDSEKINKFLEN